MVMLFGEGIQPNTVQMSPGGVMWQRHEVDRGSLVISPDCDDALIPTVLRVSTGDLSALEPIVPPGRDHNAYSLGEEHVIKAGQHVYDSSPASNSLTWGMCALRANVSLGEGFERIGANTQPIYRYRNEHTGQVSQGHTFEGVHILAAFLPEVAADTTEQQLPVWLMERASGYADRLVYVGGWQEAGDLYQAARAAVGLEKQIRIDNCGYNDIVDRSGPIARVTKIDSYAYAPIEF
jgi:hypothetical protein